MKKFRVEFVRYEVKTVAETEQDIPSNDTFLEQHTGDTIWAIIHAENEQQARAKAEQLSRSLATGNLPGDVA